MTKIAIIQTEPVFNDLSKTIEKGVQHIQEAARNGAKLIVFAEGWFAGYPAWIDHCAHVGRWDHPDIKAVWATMFQNSLELSSPEMARLQEIAVQTKTVLLFGANEKITKGVGNNTIYNAAFLIDLKGDIQIHHRKTMPTYNEKLVHGLGDGHGLKSVDLGFGKIGTLICWEHWMPLTRQTMHDENEDIHVALWPAILDRHLLASRHYAVEGRCYVIAAGQILRKSSIPDNLELPKEIIESNSEFILNGGSCIFAPDGSYLLEPVSDVETILYYDLPNVSNLIQERMNLAVSGHYQRPDIFELKVNKKRLF